MNATNAVVGFAADFPDYVDTPYKGDYLVSVQDGVTILIELDELVLDMGE